MKVLGGDHGVPQRACEAQRIQQLVVSENLHGLVGYCKTLSSGLKVLFPDRGLTRAWLDHNSRGLKYQLKFRE